MAVIFIRACFSYPLIWHAAATRSDQDWRFRLTAARLSPVKSLLACNQQTAGACITVQHRVTGQVYVTFQTEVNAIQQESIEVQYKATPRVTVSGARDQNGGFGFDTRITKTW